jgi:hypothetical protein
MTVLMTMKIQGDPGAMAKLAEADPAAFPAVLDIAHRHGVISHHFYAGAGEILVVDEWPDEASFHAFNEEAGPQIGAFMQDAGVMSAPELAFYTKMDLGDDLG